MTSADGRDPSWGPPLGGYPTDAVDVDVEEPDLLLDLSPEPEAMEVMPEQWEVVPDDEADEPHEPPVSEEPPPPPPSLQPPPPPDPSAAPDRPAAPDAPAAAPDRPAAVPVLRHVVEEPVVEEPVVEAPVVEAEPVVAVEQAPAVEAAPEFVFDPEPEPEPAPAPVVVDEELVEVAQPPTRRAGLRPAPALDAEVVPAAERVTSAMVLLLLAVVVGVGLAGLVAAVVLAITLVVRRALGG